MQKSERLNSNITLVVGSGGREDSIAQTIFRQNPHAEIIIAPGNGGTPRFGRNADVDIADIDRLVRLSSDLKVGRTIVGPESSLEEGIVNLSQENGIPIFGPTKEAARLESDKVFALRFMENHNISYPKTVITNNYNGSLEFIRDFYKYPDKLNWGGLVIKYPYLAGGKGVILPDSLEDAQKFLEDIYVNNRFGQADKLIFQEKLVGKELSVVFISDGLNAFPYLPAKDYKRARDGDKGLNTGGMGSFAPYNMSKDVFRQSRDIARKTINGMQKEGTPFRGNLYLGLMLVDGKLYLLEYNVRGGDTETQSTLPLLGTNLLNAYDSSIRGNLRPDALLFNKGFAVTFTIASDNYPEGSSKGAKIVLPKDLRSGVIINHAGTELIDGEFHTNGGRILNVTAIRNTAKEAREVGNQIADQIVFEGAYHRRDIAKEAI